MSLVLGLAGAVGGGSAWHTTVFCASHALWGSAASGEFANCGYGAEFRLALGKRWRRVWDDGEEVAYDAWSVGKVHCILPRVVVRGVPDPFNVVLLNARRSDPGRDYFFDLVLRGVGV